MITGARELRDNDNYKQNALSLNISLIRILSAKLLDQEKEVLEKYAKDVIDALIHSIRRLTLKFEEGSEDKTIYLQIRKSLGSLLEFVKRITASTKELFDSNLWFNIVNLKSLKDIQSNLPKRFS